MGGEENVEERKRVRVTRMEVEMKDRMVAAGEQRASSRRTGERETVRESLAGLGLGGLG